MAPAPSCSELYDQLTEINAHAFEQGYFEVAYHTLAAAYHCGLLLQETDLLAALERRALEQRHWIDTHASTHPLSPQSAQAKGHVDVYTSLLRHIQTRQVMQQTPHPDVPW